MGLLLLVVLVLAVALHYGAFGDRWRSRFRRGLTPERLQRVEALARYAESQGRRLLDLAVSWLLRRPVVASVIAGATSPDQVKRNALASTWKLSPAQLTDVDAIAPA